MKNKNNEYIITQSHTDSIKFNFQNFLVPWKRGRRGEGKRKRATYAIPESVGPIYNSRVLLLGCLSTSEASAKNTDPRRGNKLGGLETRLESRGQSQLSRTLLPSSPPHRSLEGPTSYRMRFRTPRHGVRFPRRSEWPNKRITRRASPRRDSVNHISSSGLSVSLLWVVLFNCGSFMLRDTGRNSVWLLSNAIETVCGFVVSAWGTGAHAFLRNVCKLSALLCCTARIGYLNFVPFKFYVHIHAYISMVIKISMVCFLNVYYNIIATLLVWFMTDPRHSFQRGCYF